MAQQTAMQALVELMKINDIYKPCMPYLLEIIDEVYLPMEKEQIVKAWELRATPYPTEGMGYSIIDATGEQYYNETYGENKD